MYKRALRLQLLSTSSVRLWQSYRQLLQVFQCFCHVLPPCLLKDAPVKLPEADLYIALESEGLALLPPLSQPVRLWSAESEVLENFLGIIGGLRLLHRLKDEEN